MLLDKKLAAFEMGGFTASLSVGVDGVYSVRTKEPLDDVPMVSVSHHDDVERAKTEFVRVVGEMLPRAQLAQLEE